MLLRAIRAGFISTTLSLVVEPVRAGDFLFAMDDVDERLALAHLDLVRSLLLKQRATIEGPQYNERLKLLEDEISLRKGAVAYAQHHYDSLNGAARIGAETEIDVAEAQALLSLAKRDQLLTEYQESTWIEKVASLDKMYLAATEQLDLRAQQLKRRQASCKVNAPVAGRTRWYAFAEGYVGPGDPIVELTS